jgi:predicted nuclease of restriction endonuclease-like RecB superfamily
MTTCGGGENQELGGPWRTRPATCLLDLPGVGVCAPDLEVEHQDTGRRVYVEVLGFWSRDAVWRRVEMVEKGLGAPIVFAVGQHLRVSEAVLGQEAPAALYVYKRTMLPKALLERVQAVVERASAATHAATVREEETSRQ